jgi:carbon monoxide dehydrogenase subunit G
LNINERAVIGVSLDELWSFVTDVPRVGACLPGTEEVTDLGDGAYGGAMRVKVGAISVRLEGKVRLVERDDADHVATLAIEALDRRVKGTVNATTRMRLTSLGEQSTELALDTEAAVAGKLGQFGQAVIQKKTRQILETFVANMTAQLQGGAPTATSEIPASGAAAVLADGWPPGPRTVVSTPPSPAPIFSTPPASSSVVGLAVSAAGAAAGIVGAVHSESAWAILGLSLVLWGALGFGRARDGR